MEQLTAATWTFPLITDSPHLAPANAPAEARRRAPRAGFVADAGRFYWRGQSTIRADRSPRALSAGEWRGSTRGRPNLGGLGTVASTLRLGLGVPTAALAP
jgi:hypothetical protein